MSSTINNSIVSILCIAVFATLSCQGQHEKIPNKTDLTFSAPWSENGNQLTNAQLWNTDDTLYFAFQVIDSSLVAKVEENFHQGIGSSDRVELFFSTDTLLSDYYGMEIGYDNRILSFHGKHYRDIDYNYTLPRASLQTSCSLKDDGYSCEGKLAISYLDSLDLIHNSRLNIGVFRADYHQAGNPLKVTWITHQDPGIPQPDFHTPTAFFKYSL